ncbi:catechol 2,3-dioxygenase-like lactoylglutathione lyase family enzyme [Agrobacterium larrymoorei]|uniref:Catechol 2,3-dioxygenase-like lactoylglutathione lyase family enzyme n=1 Tax=Agrobacterium larrymoorei TaxID=160699 RepID=A0AAJ2EV49_9HYPH|nr:VOC family protein [Agrobacterium larrymoorei]MDR6104333.1 catechol 2,3-dioxygenase-like lactoylglutathione lyase family enzyme [Agrobacterium larrymoorei]
MTILRLDHVQLAMPEGGEQTARHFYADLLGLEEVEKPANLAGRGGCWFALGDVSVHLGVAADFVAAAKAHPAFVVDDLAELGKRLETAGCHVVEDEPLEGYHRFYVYDPFGNRIEMMQPLEP